MKKSFLVFKNQKYTTVKTDDIAFFNVRNNIVSLVSFEKQSFILGRSLEQIASSVSPEQFFRVNRQYLVNFSAIREVELFYMRKLHVKLRVDTSEELFINKEKSADFLAWMENR